VPPRAPYRTVQQFQAAGHVAAVNCTGLIQTAGQFCTFIVLPDNGPVRKKHVAVSAFCNITLNLTQSFEILGA